MKNLEDEISHLREALKICEERLKEYRALLEISVLILTNKDVLVIKKDDQLITNIESYVQKIQELGIPES